MAATLTTSTAFRTLKATLNAIVTDRSDGYQDRLVATQYMTEDMMPDNYIDDLENGGPGLASEVPEGQVFPVGSLYEGLVQRYTARKFGLLMQVTEELDEDGKYNDKYLDMARRNKRALYKTLDVDCANVLNRAANSNYVGGDGVPLASSSHPLPGGGTFSNTLSTPFTPSRAALSVVRNNLDVMPGHDGVIEGYAITAIVHPSNQWMAWAGILGSEKAPESNANEINVFYDMKIKQVGVRYMTSTTNWGVITDAPNGLKLFWRNKPKASTFYKEEAEIINHKISARWARGWTDPRGFYFSNA